MNKALVSIIIPIYNGDTYLRKCMDSILKQNYPDLEVILINDGSSDHSLDVCKEYAEADGRIKIVDKENTGVSDSRNRGIKIAQGEFIVFADCDDYVDEGYIGHLCGLMDDGIDLGICGWIKENEEGTELGRARFYSQIFDKEKSMECLVSMSGGVHGYPISKIFRRRLLDDFGIKFDKEIYIFEDLLFCLQYLNHCENIKMDTGICEYHYVLHDSSSRTKTMRADTFQKFWLTEIEALYRLLNFTQGMRRIENIVKARLAFSSVFYINRMQECGYKDKEEVKRLQKNIRKYFVKVLTTREGDLKWKIQVLLCALSPKLEMYFRKKLTENHRFQNLCC